MANVIDETNKEVYDGLNQTTETALEFLKEFIEMLSQRRTLNLKMDLAETYRPDHIKVYDEELKELTKAEQKLFKKYKALYDEARETKNYKEILPQTYEELESYVRNGINPKETLFRCYENPDMVLFLKQYANEYEDLKYDELLYEQAENLRGLNWETLDELTDFTEEVLNPMIEEIQREQEQNKNKVLKVKEAIFGNDTKYALENFNGLLWNDPDQETVENWIKTDFDDRIQAINGIEMQVSEWTKNMGLHVGGGNYQFDIPINDYQAHTIILTYEEMDQLNEMIVDDIVIFHQHEHADLQKQNYENLLDSIFENEKLTIPTGSNEITDIIQGDER